MISSSIIDIRCFLLKSQDVKNIIYSLKVNNIEHKPMSLKQYLIQFTFWSLLWIAQNSYAQALSLTLNKSAVTVGDTLTISASVESAAITASQVDVYLSVQLPNGELYYVTDIDAKFAELNHVIPLIRQWFIVTLPEINIISFKIPDGLPNGTYKWYLTFCQTGQDVTQPANWIANASATLTLSGSRYDDYYYDKETGYEYEEAAPMDDGVAMPTAAGSSRPATSEDVVYPAAPPMDEGIATDTTSDFIDEPEVISSPGEANFQSGTLTAGDLDDNLNFAAFKEYLSQQLQNDSTSILPVVTVSDRIQLRVVDENAQGVGNAQIQITPSQSQSSVFTGFTATNGDFYLFPQFDLGKLKETSLQLAISPPQDATGSPVTIGLTTTIDITKQSADQVITLTLPQVKATLPHALDIMLVIDTTGSMSDELSYLATEFHDIVSSVTAQHPNIDMRFGLTVYRDEGDMYVVKPFDFVSSINQMQNQLGQQSSGGGGDYPEAMEQAMQEALQAQWRKGNVARLLFLVADAPPHDENLSTMLEQVRSAKQMGIKIYPLAASGVADVAEYIMRVAGIITQGRYLFLTDDSGVGGSHATPSSRCYIVTRLDQLISRVIASELAGQRIEPSETEIIRTVGQYHQGYCTQ